MRVVLTRAASTDLENVLRYIAADNPSAAARVAARIDRALSLIGDFPGAGRLDQNTGASEWLVTGLPLLVIYTVQTDFVEVIGLFHTSRDPQTKPRP
jgi:plasmid stabilization system protein ParE